MSRHNATKNTLSSHTPKYVKIAEDLKADIAAGVLAPDDRLPSYAEMTEHYKVAKHTIDRAHAILEQEGLIRREQGRGIFVAPRTINRTGNIGLLLRGANQYQPCVRELILGIQKKVREYDLNVMLMDEHDTLVDKNIDGVLICSNHLEVTLIDFPPSMPRVLLWEPASIVDIANVVADDFNGSRLATRHLLEQGHRRISFLLAAEYDSFSVQRFAGYRAALDEFDIKFDARLCHYINRAPLLYDAEQGLREWMQQGWRDLKSTAILAPNDTGAFAMYKVLKEAGIRVPEDISLVGFDGLRLPQSDLLDLTTIEVPFREIGARGAEVLWEQIQQGGHETKKYVEPVHLKAGKSTLAL